ncbi:MAG TPA: PKD domain-containing protein, partial [Vicinamibacterales bacterium]|nr:PKD domain-containing protein [Vicinamibacterales bacterium]
TYGGGDGTSFATPLVSGYVGLLLSQNPGATLAPQPNILPVAIAGPDQTVAVKGKASTSTVTLDASASYDPDGTLVSYQWLEDDTPIATGQTISVNLPMGSHTITLRVTDDDQASSEDRVIIEVGKRGGGGGGRK